VSLFGEASDVQIPEPVVPPCEDWSTMEKLAKEKEVVGIYISGHPLDDYKFEMQYFCNAKLEVLKDLGSQVNKNLSVGGIITNVQHRVAKNGKGWASFTLEGFDENYEFRIFGEEYLKFRHYLIPNNFTYIRLLVKEGWADRETGKKGEPRLQFLNVHYLQDVLPTYAKKLIIHMNIKDLQSDLIARLQNAFQSNRGDHSVTFELLELETIKKQVEVVAPVFINSDEIATEDEIVIIAEDAEPEMKISEEKDEIRIITKLSMPSRKLKVNISNELLQEIEKMQLNFRLN
jgi:DNA polymerase-3 subunit alpha